MSESCEAALFDVQRFSIHDGPGIRTTVFFKGCSLSCEWCQNPEALRASPEIAYYEEQCLAGCSRCESLCPDDAIRPRRSQRVDFERCRACGKCVDVCPPGALRRVGRMVAAGRLLEEVCRDRSFYVATGGGITLSGGEPLLKAAFLREFLPLAKAEGLHVAIETSGAWRFSRIEGLIPHLDLVLFDIKVIDPELHARYTGRDNRRVLENLARLQTTEVEVEVRMPVVPGRTTDASNVVATASLLTGLGIGSLTLLPYNHLWEAKLPRLGTARSPLGICPPGDDFYRCLRADFARCGIEARI